MILTILITFCVIQLGQCDSPADIMQYRQECKLKLGLDANYAKNLAQFNLLTNSQFHDLQCLERCILIKRGIINENETLQEGKLKEHFPNINITKDFSKTCPVIANVTEKCEKGYLIGKCLQFQAPGPWKNHKPHFKNVPSPERHQYRMECLQDNSTGINKIMINSDQQTRRFQSEWCVERCIMIKMGIINENNVIQAANITEIFGNNQIDVSQCAKIKNEDKCKEAMDIRRCLNRIPLLHI